MTNLVADYARLMRLPGLGGLSIAPVFGAISLFSSQFTVSLQDLGLLFLVGIFSAIYGFVLNDYIDVEVDRLSQELSERPLVKGTISKRTALIICILCIIGAFTIIFFFFYRNHPSFYLGILSIILSAVLGSLYNIFGKKIIGSDFLVALSEAFLVLFGVFMVSPDGSLTIFSWLIFLLTFNQVLYLNAVDGGIKDADHDVLMNVKNIALTSGVVVTAEKQLHIPTSFKSFGLGIRIFSACLVFIPIFYGIHYAWWNLGLLLVIVGCVIYGSAKLLSTKIFDRKQMRKSISIQTFLRYFYVPLMLLPIIGALSAFLLIIFPFVWYLLFTPLIGGKIFQPGI